MESSGRREIIVLRKEVGILHIQCDELLFPGNIKLQYLVLKGSEVNQVERNSRCSDVVMVGFELDLVHSSY